GIDGAKAVGEVLKDMQIDAVYTSTSKRTQDTAAYILGDREIEIRPLEELKEMGFGTWEGIRVTEIDEKHPEERAKILHSPETYKAEGAVLMEMPIPEINDHEVLIQVKATSICGTDVHIYNWDDWAKGRVKAPYIFGHEFTGEVVKAGKQVSRAKVGDFVSAETHVVCNQCY
ncbi:histidine phosphatase family protein, partial [Listeria monocytogenes]|uniref:histidine phosphatase family protein n=1 Tax=Listeria monocytogenes TaxID=1639 RepID=UPI0032047FFD